MPYNARIMKGYSGTRNEAGRSLYVNCGLQYIIIMLQFTDELGRQKWNTYIALSPNGSYSVHDKQRANL